MAMSTCKIAKPMEQSFQARQFKRVISKVEMWGWFFLASEINPQSSPPAFQVVSVMAKHASTDEFIFLGEMSPFIQMDGNLLWKLLTSSAENSWKKKTFLWWIHNLKIMKCLNLIEAFAIHEILSKYWYKKCDVIPELDTSFSVVNLQDILGMTYFYHIFLFLHLSIVDKAKWFIYLVISCQDLVWGSRDQKYFLLLRSFSLKRKTDLDKSQIVYFKAGYMAPICQVWPHKVIKRNG